MDSLDSSSDVRFVPSVRLKGTSLGSPKASTSGSSSGVPTPIDAKSQRDLEVMKACHDFDLAVTEGSLTVIRKHYSIAEEYALHALLPEQQPYNLGSFELNISVNALEADLRFPLHPIIEECLGHDGLGITPCIPKVLTGKSTLAAQVTTSPEVEEVQVEVAPRTALAQTLKRQAKKLASQ
ncbi:hypothetical protein BHM03_00056193 [Ensete ventricosum]|nr:hypothetical protein BHM03_00056193 [Ensete ventricosum]